MSKTIGTREHQWLSLGGVKGHRFIGSGFSATPGEVFYAFNVISDCSISYVNSDGGDNASTKSLPSGSWVFGTFPASDGTVASGEVIGYLR